MSGHTPGQWHKSKTHLGNAYDIGSDRNENIALVYGPAHGGSEDFEAIADLFVAAPEILKALKGVVSLKHEHATGCVCPWCFARAAIARAEPHKADDDG